MRSDSVGSGVCLSLILSERHPTALKQLLGNTTAVIQIKLEMFCILLHETSKQSLFFGVVYSAQAIKYRNYV